MSEQSNDDTQNIFEQRIEGLINKFISDMKENGINDLAIIVEMPNKPPMLATSNDIYDTCKMVASVYRAMKNQIDEELRTQ